MKEHNQTIRKLINRAGDLAWRHQCGLESFGAALNAYRDAERFADEGPGDPLTAEQCHALERVRQSLPEWAT